MDGLSKAMNHLTLADVSTSVRTATFPSRDESQWCHWLKLLLDTLLWEMFDNRDGS
jgi:hypothetical protein